MRRGEIADDIDTGVRKHIHTIVVVFGWVDGVGADKVDAQLLEVFDIALALVTVREGIDVMVFAGLAGALSTTAVVVLCVLLVIGQELGGLTS